MLPVLARRDRGVRAVSEVMNRILRAIPEQIDEQVVPPTVAVGKRPGASVFPERSTEGSTLAQVFDIYGVRASCITGWTAC